MFFYLIEKIIQNGILQFYFINWNFIKQFYREIVKRLLTFMNPRNIKATKMTQSDGDTLTRLNTSNLFNTGPTSQQQYRKVVNSLEFNLKQERLQKQQLQEKVKHIQLRTIERQKQFHRILNKYDSNISKYNRTETQLDKLYTHIIESFSENQNKINESLEARYKENLTIMDRKIGAIVAKMQNQLAKNFKMSEAENSQLRTEISRLQAVALQIQKANTQLVKTNNSQQFKIKVLNQEKKLLIQQLNEKRCLAKKYFIKSKSVNRDSKSERNSQLSDSRISKASSILNSKSKTKERQQSVKFKYNTIVTMEPKSVQLRNGKKMDYSSYLPQKIKTINSSFFGLSNPNKKQFISTMTLTVPDSTQRNLKSKQQPRTQQSPQANTINNLKNTITRQKRKRAQYQSMLTDLQQKIILIDKIVIQSLKKFNNDRQLSRAQNQTSETTFQHLQTKSDKMIDNNENGNGNHKEELGWIVKILQKVKNIISGNEDLKSHGELIGIQDKKLYQSRKQYQGLLDLISPYDDE